MKKILFSLILAVLCAAIVDAQVRQVSGSVKDEKGAAVPLATIKIKGSQTSVLADDNGNFKISDLKGSRKICFQNFFKQKSEI